MAEQEGFEVDQLGVIEGTSFSQLLYEVEHDVVGLSVADHHHQTQIFNYNNNTNSCSSLYSATTDLKSPKMLCFGDFQNKDNNNHQFGDIGFPEIPVSRPPAQKSGLTCSDSSSVSSASTKTAKPNSNNKKRNGVALEQVQSGNNNNTQAGLRSTKKPKTEKPAAGKRREKLGERISALQQLVSPFGKTDTASVLHEAMGYIRFLHDQVQVLCSPYLERLPSLPEGGGRADEAAARRSNDLRSRGLCLVPMDYTAHMANNNGADFWSPATMANHTNNVASSTGYLIKD